MISGQISLRRELVTSVEFAIETIDLVKRYPTNARNQHNHVHIGGAHVHPVGGILNLFKSNRGPFIEALRGINLKVKEGEIFGVLGPNGAGKTTLIKILCTLVMHDEGQVYVHGIDVKKEPAKVLKNLQAVLPESRGFNWRLTGRQNLEFFALLYGLQDTVAKPRIEYLLEFTGLKDRANDDYQRFSTGMQRKLLLSRALLRNTPILLFDEPTAGLDPTSAAEFRSLLLERLVREEKKTILLSTHNLTEAQSLCDRIAILDAGKIIMCDTPDNIRCKVFEQKVVQITFQEVSLEGERATMLTDLKGMAGVDAVTPEFTTGNLLSGLSMRVGKEVDLTGFLEQFLRRGLKIKTINTREPSLEDAFIAITGKRPESGDARRFRGPPPPPPGGF